MTRSAETKETKGTQPTSADTLTPSSPQAALAPPDALTRSSVYRRLPVHLRTRLDEAILLRPQGLTTLEAIAAHFDLARHKISPAALRTYARRLEELARPAAAGQFLAVILGCLPARHRRRMLSGTHVLLLSRFTQALSSNLAVPLSVAELARLGSALSAMARRRPRRNGAGAKRSQRRLPSPGQKEIQTPVLKELVRNVYGLTMPTVPAPESSLQPPSQAPPDRGRDSRSGT